MYVCTWCVFCFCIFLIVFFSRFSAVEIERGLWASAGCCIYFSFIFLTAFICFIRQPASQSASQAQSKNNTKQSKVKSETSWNRAEDVTRKSIRVTHLARNEIKWKSNLEYGILLLYSWRPSRRQARRRRRRRRRSCLCLWLSDCYNANAWAGNYLNIYIYFDRTAGNSFISFFSFFLYFFFYHEATIRTTTATITATAAAATIKTDGVAVVCRRCFRH